MSKFSKKTKDVKSFSMDLSKVYEVIFIKDGKVFKTGDTTNVNLALASKFIQQGKIDYTPELKEAAKKAKCEEIFIVKKKEKEHKL